MIAFFVPGKPKPQGRPRAFSRGKFTKVYSPLTEWRCTVMKYASDVLPNQQLTTPLKVSICYQFHRPKAHYGTGRNEGKLKASAPTHHTKTPDLDNLNKAVLDAIGDSGIIGNDSQVITLVSNKIYCGSDAKEGATISIEVICE